MRVVSIDGAMIGCVDDRVCCFRVCHCNAFDVAGCVVLCRVTECLRSLHHMMGEDGCVVCVLSLPRCCPSYSISCRSMRSQSLPCSSFVSPTRCRVN